MLPTVPTMPRNQIDSIVPSFGRETQLPEDMDQDAEVQIARSKCCASHGATASVAAVVCDGFARQGRLSNGYLRIRAGLHVGSGPTAVGISPEEKSQGVGKNGRRGPLSSPGARTVPDNSKRADS